MTKQSQLIGIVGHAQSGKDTIADYLVKNYGFTKLSFATKVKKITKSLFNIPNNTAKTTQLPLWGMTYRDLLQQVGSKLREIHPDIWVNPIIGEILVCNIFGNSSENFAISDVRYLNELNAIRQEGGKLIKIIRTNFVTDLTIEEEKHPSETELNNVPNSEFNLVITAESGDIHKIYMGIDKFMEGMCSE